MATFAQLDEQSYQHFRRPGRTLSWASGVRGDLQLFEVDVRLLGQDLRHLQAAFAYRGALGVFFRKRSRVGLIMRNKRALQTTSNSLLVFGTQSRSHEWRTFLCLKQTRL